MKNVLSVGLTLLTLLSSTPVIAQTTAEQNFREDYSNYFRTDRGYYPTSQWVNEAVDNAFNVCKFLRNEGTLKGIDDSIEIVVSQVEDEEYKKDLATSFASSVVFGVEHFCPEYRNDVYEYTNSLN
jgi:hypothetical protein